MVAILSLISLIACIIVIVTSQIAPTPPTNFWGSFAQQARSSVQAIPTQFQGSWKNMQDASTQFGTQARNFGTQAAQQFQSFGTQAATKARTFGSQIAQGAVNATQRAGDGFKQFAASAQNFFARQPTV